VHKIKREFIIILFRLHASSSLSSTSKKFSNVNKKIMELSKGSSLQ
jgi:hypothetical protein